MRSRAIRATGPTHWHSPITGDAAPVYPAPERTIQDADRYQLRGVPNVGAAASAQVAELLFRSLRARVGYWGRMTTSCSYCVSAQSECCDQSTAPSHRLAAAWLALALTMMTAITSVPLPAQVAGKTVIPTTGAGALGTGIIAPVMLRVRPETGDVLLLHMQQTVEMGGQRLESYSLPRSTVKTLPGREPARTPPRGPLRSALPTRVTVTDFYAHSAVELSDAAGAIVATVVDSLVVKTGTLQQLRGQRVSMDAYATPTRIRVKPNGSMSMVDAPSNVTSVGSSLAAMSAMLPDGPVKVGDTWERDVDVPQIPVASYRADGVLHAIFRLDSISRNGQEAYVSMRGTLSREGARRDLPRGTRVITDGIMSGTLLLDRVRGWITEADTVIDVISEMVGVTDPGQSMQAGIRITQQLRVR